MQNDQFPPANLSAGFGFSKQTLAGARGNDEVAPIPAVRGSRSNRSRRPSTAVRYLAKEHRGDLGSRHGEAARAR